MAEVQVADLREDGVLAIDPEALRRAAESVLEAEGRGDAHLSVTVVDDARMAELHEQYLNVAGPTDVLSFPLDDDVPSPIPLLGEVVVSADTAAREATERGLPWERELLLYVIHGTLHLLGYDDHEEDERVRMHARQEELLDELSLPRSLD
jgi:probable rRNA maturation factor